MYQKMGKFERQKEKTPDFWMAKSQFRQIGRTF
jgi:hypothetical protein